MPALVTCRGNCLETQWNVGSDDFAVPAFISIVAALMSSTLIMAALASLWLSPLCESRDNSIHPLIYCSFIALLLIEAAIMINETVIMSISCRGSIWDSSPRRGITKYIYVRIFWAVLELVCGILCTAAIFAPAIVREIDCNSYRVALALAEVSIVLLWAKIVIHVLRICWFIDPCGCFTPGLLQHLTFLDNSDERGDFPSPLARERTESWLKRFFHLGRPRVRSVYEVADVVDGHVKETQSVRFWQSQVSVPQKLYGGLTPEQLTKQVTRFHRSHVGFRRIERRLKVLFCCLCVGGHRSRGLAVEDIARALYTLFDFEDEDSEEGEGGKLLLVLSDVIAGFKLLNRYQKNKLKAGKKLEEKFRQVTFDNMPMNQKPHYRYKTPRPFILTDLKNHLLVDRLVHYMQYAMGIYGWPLYIFANMACGLCHLASKTCCVCKCCRHQDAEKFYLEDRCMCGVAAMRQQTSIEEEDVYYMSMDNRIYKAPFAVCVDHKMKSVVVIVRGTLSIKDALTDMSYTLHYVKVPGVNETYVHKGMYAAADEIKRKLIGKSREEVLYDSINSASTTCQQEVEEEVEQSLQSQRKILEEIYSQEELKDYQLIVAGHSLGAGVASVLAFLLRAHYPDLHCYAYSPPGCVFSYPLALFSKKFTTTVVLGNDVIPRVSFRSLLFLKESVKRLLKMCPESKSQVLCQPKWCSRLSRNKPTSCDAALDDLEKAIVSNKTTDKSLQNAVFPPVTVSLAPPATTPGLRDTQQASFDMLSPYTFEKNISDHVKTKSGQFMPTFPPGKIYHLKVTKNNKPCFLGCCHPSEMEMVRVRNEDLCVILMDKGIVEDHMPNHVLDSLVRFKKQAILPHYSHTGVEEIKSKQETDRQARRKARERTETTGQWHFPSPSNSEDTDSPASQAQPFKVTQDVMRTHTALATIHESAECSDSDTDCETTCSDPPQLTTVEVEVHDEAPLNLAATVERGATGTIEMGEHPPSAEKVMLRSENQTRCESEPNNKETIAQRPRLHREMRIDLDDGKTGENTNGSASDSKTNKNDSNSSASRAAAAELWKRRSRETGGRAQTPTSIPVRVPYSSPASQSRRLRVTIPSSAKQSTPYLKTNPPSFFRQLSRGRASPSTILTVEGRRGQKLKLKLPPRASESSAV